MAKAGAAQLVDGAMVEWAESQTKPQTTQLMGRFANGTMGKPFWGALFGQLLSKAEPEEGHGDVPESGGVQAGLARRCGGMSWYAFRVMQRRDTTHALGSVVVLLPCIPA
ncbi:MAG: hypothetical protein ACHQEA_00095 [Gaiellales bacterium]